MSNKTSKPTPSSNNDKLEISINSEEPFSPSKDGEKIIIGPSMKIELEETPLPPKK